MRNDPLSFYLIEGVDLAVDVDWNALPEGLRELKEALGPEDALTVSRALGGANLYVPRWPAENSPLTRRLGMRLALEMARRYGGMTICVPKPDAVYRQFRLKALLQRRQKGASLSQLALDFGLSRRRVMQLLSTQEPNSTNTI